MMKKAIVGLKKLRQNKLTFSLHFSRTILKHPHNTALKTLVYQQYYLIIYLHAEPCGIYRYFRAKRIRHNLVSLQGDFVI